MITTDAGPYQVFLASPFQDFQELRRAIVRQSRHFLPVAAEIIDLDDGRARSASPSVVSIEQAREADVVVLMIGNSYGDPPPGHDKSYIHLEYEAARGGTVLAFRTLPKDASTSPADPRLNEFLDQVRTSCTIGEFRPDDMLGAVELILLSLGERLKELDDAEQERNRNELASSRGLVLGRQIVSTRNNHWKNTEIGPLERRVFGQPRPRQANVESTNLVGRADDEWNEACRAFVVASADIAVLHLERAVELRPLDGGARFWLARLGLAEPPDIAKYEAVAGNAAVAAAALERSRISADRASLSYLVQAKALRALGDLANWKTAAERSAAVLESAYYEPHLELSYANTVLGDRAAAFESMRRAFSVSPLALNAARRELANLDNGTANYTWFAEQLSVEVTRHVADMRAYGRKLADESFALERRLASVKPDLDRLTDRELPPATRIRMSLRQRGDNTGDDGGHAGDQDEEVRFAVRPPADLHRKNAAGKPVELAREGSAIANDNIERLRDYELLLQFSAKLARGAQTLEQEVVAKFAASVRLAGYCALAVILSGALTAGLVQRSFQAAGLTVLMLVVVAYALWLLVIGAHRDKLARIRPVSFRSSGLFVEGVRSFEELARSFEESHIFWAAYSPRSTARPLFREEWTGAALYIRRHSQEQAVARRMDQRLLAPDLRVLYNALQKERPPAPKPTYVAPDGRDPILDLGSPLDFAQPVVPEPDYRLYGEVELMGEKTTNPRLQRWLAYRKAGTGPTGLA
ncbi:MAG: DUF4062 domain-containing protein [Acidimicrobiales bacterium]